MVERTKQLAVPVSSRDHVRGNICAPVALVEYGDYESRRCRAAEKVVGRVLHWFGVEGVCVVFRHFPVAVRQGRRAHLAEAAEAAGAQGRFWEMHDRLFARGGKLNDEAVVEYATRLGLDVERFTHDVTGGVHAARVEADYEGGVRSGVSRVPTFFINGVRHDAPWDEETLIDHLAAAGDAVQPRRVNVRGNGHG